MLALKKNHPLLHDEVKTYFEDARQGDEKAKQGYEVYTTTEKGHGRIEKRIYRYSTEIDWLAPRKE